MRKNYKPADEIKQALLTWCTHNSSDIAIPNYYFGNYEMDVFKVNYQGITTEYEIKVSVNDYKRDFKKGDKHKNISEGFGYSNRFFFVVPKGLIKFNEVPEYAGLLCFNENKGFDFVKQAPLTHKRFVMDPVSFYKKIAFKLSFREQNERKKIERISRFYGDFTPKEILELLNSGKVGQYKYEKLLEAAKLERKAKRDLIKSLQNNPKNQK